jgi:hypothetical protein|tara:strand:- start:270 stop:680 length:411 start_codon:yes stop_codon:yes gene_type:complete
MNKNELKKILKPLIKECIKEVIFEEDGALSHIIKEVAGGLGGKQQISEPAARPFKNKKKSIDELRQRKKQLLDAIGVDSYGGVDVFQGTTPAPAPRNEGQARGPLADVAPNDPGVDISDIFSEKAFLMTQRLMEKK